MKEEWNEKKQQWLDTGVYLEQSNLLTAVVVYRINTDFETI